ALGMLVSPRDIRAIRLMNRLSRSKTVDEEREVVSALADSTSRLPVHELMARIESPSLIIRMEALNALRSSPLTAEMEDRLIAEVTNHRYTTAHLAAELLGNARIRRAVPALRDAVESHDYMVSAKSMVALAQIGDRDSIGRIEAILERSPNPRVTIYAVKALEIFASIDSLPLIFRRVERRAEVFVRDELILSSAALLGIYEFFYPLYLEFLEDQPEGLRTLGDHAGGGDRAGGGGDDARATAAAAISALQSDPRRFNRLAVEHFSLRSFVVGTVDTAPWFIDALKNRNVGQLERFRFFVASVMVSPARYTSPSTTAERSSHHE
ncbi:MAG: HEAT repeat domain-containing protein, partial [Spirochaetota bacterium]